MLSWQKRVMHQQEINSTIKLKFNLMNVSNHFQTKDYIDMNMIVIQNKTVSTSQISMILSNKIKMKVLKILIMIDEPHLTQLLQPNPSVQL